MLVRQQFKGRTLIDEVHGLYLKSAQAKWYAPRVQSKRVIYVVRVFINFLLVVLWLITWCEPNRDLDVTLLKHSGLKHQNCFTYFTQLLFYTMQLMALLLIGVTWINIIYLLLSSQNYAICYCTRTQSHTVIFLVVTHGTQIFVCNSIRRTLCTNFCLLFDLHSTQRGTFRTLP